MQSKLILKRILIRDNFFEPYEKLEDIIIETDRKFATNASYVYKGYAFAIVETVEDIDNNRKIYNTHPIYQEMSLEQKLEQLKNDNGVLRDKLYRLENRKLWQRIFNK